ncbi:hypothetical protein [Aureliella helgolandensis]|uniref:Uncharacterized protein n=1 Tax=Aureliella helgolandensis TaxID=2527968 RepID=A0A518G8U6_9BACT|nr:hypothetical protein [Aureliella helgolandensis]QDV25025.1 hypothetical protein Q31a_33470 [Aureliella helgolandensis]
MASSRDRNQMATGGTAHGVTAPPCPTAAGLWLVSVPDTFQTHDVA